MALEGARRRYHAQCGRTEVRVRVRIPASFTLATLPPRRMDELPLGWCRRRTPRDASRVFSATPGRSFTLGCSLMFTCFARMG
eukprot:31072-Pelagococcus_subviridis.AAC.8